MKKLLAAVCLSVFMFGAAHAEEIYDPQHTMLALNMAIVSINRILTTQDRAVLEWEYDNIINRLAFGNIESDSEIIDLYQELLNFINGKKLRQEDSRKLRESYERRQKEAYYRSMYEGFAALSLIPTDSMQATTTISSDSSSTTVGGEVGGTVTERSLSGWFKAFFSKQESHTLTTQDPFLPLLGWCRNLSLSAVSSMGMSYYGYHAERERIRSEIDSEQWQLCRDELEACNALQTKLLNSSWRLLRQYKLPDEYRLTENSLSKFFKAMESENSNTRLKMLKMIERDMSAYPPYWFYRAMSAFDSGDEDESALCFTKFNEVWRPVLRKDCCKAEAAKYRLNRIIHTTEPTKEALDEIRALADTIKRYAPEDDWSSNMFCAFVYFGVGDREKAVMCLEENLLFGYEKEFSGVVLEEMKKNSEGFTFREINEAIRKYELLRRRKEFVVSVKDSELAGVLTKYFDSCDIEAFAGFEHLMKGEFKESKQYFCKLEEYCGGLYIIGTMYAKGLEVVKDYR